MSGATVAVDEYLSNLSDDRRATLSQLRQLVLANLPSGYQESMTWGMPTYEIPLTTYGDTYNKKPLMYVAFASQKNYMSLYLTNVYMEGLEQDFRRAYEATGKKLDMGKSCIRFKSLDDLPLELIATQIASTPVRQCIQYYQSVRRQ